jgi:hypothetical protein
LVYKISKEYSAFLFRVVEFQEHLEDEGTMFLQNLRNQLPGDTGHISEHWGP